MGEILDLSHVRLSDRPLVVCDVDDVVLHFAAPFQDFLLAGGHELIPRSFRLTGNIVARETQVALGETDVRNLILAFFEAQETHQVPFDQVVETLCDLYTDADIVFLTAMPPRFRETRRRLLDRLGLEFPLVASEEPKGPILRKLHGKRDQPCVFIDEMVHNLQSVQDNVPECLVLHMMPDSELHLLAPKAADGVPRAMDWPHAADLIRVHFEKTARES
jgi:hypothetical protein